MYVLYMPQPHKNVIADLVVSNLLDRREKEKKTPPNQFRATKKAIKINDR